MFLKCSVLNSFVYLADHNGEDFFFLVAVEANIKKYYIVAPLEKKV